MSRRMRNGLVVVVVLVLVVALVVVARALWERSHRSPLEQALAAVPAASLRVSFTDWSAVRRAVGVKSTTSGSSIDTLMGKAYDKDLSAASSLSDSASAVQRNFGFSPGNAEWEAYAQSRKGAAMVLRMPDDFDLARVRDQLTSAGFRKPGSDTGVWRGGVDLVANLDPTISPELQYVVVLDDEHTVVSSDSASYAATAARVVRGKAKSLADVDGIGALTDATRRPVVAGVLWSRDFACEDLAMSQADDDDQQHAKDLIAGAGKVTPLTGLLMALSAGGSMDVVEGFASSDQAKENLRARAKLAVGEAVGRGLDLSDDYRLTRSATHDSTVVLTLKPRPGVGFVLSALDNGPVIFATC